MNADDTFGASQSNPRLRWRTSSLGAFLRDMQAQVEGNTRAMRQFSSQLLHELSRRTGPSLSNQAWQAAAQAVAHAQAQPIQLAPTPMQDTRPQALPAVRSIRWVEPAPGRAQPLVRLRLSGRFSDVCAELERLAAQETRS